MYATGRTERYVRYGRYGQGGSRKALNNAATLAYIQKPQNAKRRP